MNKACLANIIKRHLSEYRDQHPLSPQQASVCQSIIQCRTEDMGGFVQECLACGHQQESFRSCRNRHCPQCQQTKSQDWYDQQMAQILPVNYHHMVFTLPHELNGWAQLHPDELYHLLFRAAWETLKQFADGGRHLSGQLGVTFVLHTWGQALTQHIHLHGMIPAGALSADGKHWNTTDKDSELTKWRHFVRKTSASPMVDFCSQNSIFEVPNR